MPTITPSQLPTPAVIDTSVLVVTVGAASRKVTILELRDTLTQQTTPSEYVDTAINTRWTIPQQQVANALDLLSPIDHTHESTEVGLENVANVTPEDMPISIAAQNALSLKRNAVSVTPTLTEWALLSPPQW